jgi:GTP-binding protein HflX
LIETQKQSERTVLVCHSNRSDTKNFHSEESLDELKFLAETAGAYVIRSFYQQRISYDPRYLIGKGKVEEIAGYVNENNIALVIFENELAFNQLRNLEKIIKCRIIDKSNLILDIFATNARTAQAKLQVELAQLEYLLPRLTRQWTHLSKQYGGIGTKGPGETQIETDRRLVKTRISILKDKLKKIDRQMKTQSSERKKFIRLSLVGYTNAGKSTLLNLLTGSSVYVRDKLFATLDTSTRTLKIAEGSDHGPASRFPKKVLISDTVGFIKNLPHDLIESFKSTLSEVVESDILLHVIDISNPNFKDQINVVQETLKEIGANDKTIINVFNKVDQLEDTEIIKSLNNHYENSIFMSAKKGLNVNSLIEKIKDNLVKENIEKTIKLKSDNFKGLSEIYKLAEVKEVKYLKSGIKVKVRTNKKNFTKLEKN